MRVNAARSALLLVMMGMLLLWHAAPALAIEGGGTVVTGTPAATPATVEPGVGFQPSACDSHVGLTNRIAGCIRATIDASAATFFAEFYPMVQTAITAVMTLAVIVYGILMAYGMVEKIGRDTMLILLKVAGVAMFTTSSPMIYGWVTQAMDGAAVAAVSYVPASGTAYTASSGGTRDGDLSQSQCLQTMIETQQQQDPSKPPVGPWLGIDCLIDTVVGIRGASELSTSKARDSGAGMNKALDPDQKGMSRGLLFFFFSGMQSSVIGLILAVIGFVFIFGLLTLIVQAFFTYIAAYVGIALLVTVSPLFIPLILFPPTKQYFDKWVKLLISFALQPVLILVFISFSIAAMDFAVFSGNYSIIYRIAGEASRAPGFNFNKYLDCAEGKARGEEGVSDCIIKRTPRELAQVKGYDATQQVPMDKALVGGTFSSAAQSLCSPEAIKKDTTGALKKQCGPTYAWKTWMESIDWEKMATAREAMGPPVVLADGAETKGQQISREVVASVLFCAVVMFVLKGMLAIVPMIANDILGDAHQTPSLMGMFSGKSAGVGNLSGGFMSRMNKTLGRG